MGALTLSQNTSPRHEAAIYQFNARTPQSQPPREPQAVSRQAPLEPPSVCSVAALSLVTLVQLMENSSFYPPCLPPNKGRVGKRTLTLL